MIKLIISNIKNILKEIIHLYLIKNRVIIIILVILLTSPEINSAYPYNEGKELFAKHCSGCHMNGGNVIRRNKGLKLKNLKKNGINDVETIAKIAREGLGIMDGYANYLKDGEDLVVANWIWDQAQNAWTH